MALPIGTILDGKFKIVQVLGEGGMGTVYKVEQVGTPPGTPPYYYAVKELLISPNTSEEDRKAAIERFNKEIALLRGLKHPRIAALMFPFQERGNSYFAMEFVPGRSLEKILEDTKSPLPEIQVIKWMMQVCEALSYIHSRTPPIILRDLKPGNIMVTADDEVQLIDFGIARRFDPSKRTNTENLGTISYASPEHLGSITAPGQRRSAQHPGKLVQTDARSDIYSLGATMYHLLTNYEPDPIQTPAPGSILAKNPRLRTQVVNGRVFCPVEQVIIKAMQQSPDQRFQSAEAMRVALQHCLPGGAANPAVGSTTIQIPAIASPNATMIVPAMGATNGSASTAGGVVCPRCGFQNRPGAKFCKRDGQPLVAGISAPPQQARSVVPRVPIQPRPARPSPIQARPVQSNSIQARPVQSNTIQARPVRPGSIQARPVQVSSAPATATASAGAATLDPAQAYRVGLQLLSGKQYLDAIKQFEIAGRAGQTYDILYNLGRAYRQYSLSVRDRDPRLFQDNMKLAIEHFQKAVGMRSDALDSQFLLGMCCRDIELYAMATTAFKKALQLKPDDPAIYYQLGLLAVDQSQTREAEAYYKDGLKIKPDHTLILLALGRLYMESRAQLPAAVQSLRQVVQIDPDLWEGWYELGRAHTKDKDWTFALSAFKQALRVNPNNAQIYSSMALCYQKMNNKSEARRMVDEALQRDPGNAEALRLKKQM